MLNIACDEQEQRGRNTMILTQGHQDMLDGKYGTGVAYATKIQMAR